MGALTMEVEKMNKTIIENQKEVEKLTRQLEKAKEEKCDRIEVQVYNFTPEAQSFMSALGLDILSYQYEFRVHKK